MNILLTNDDGYESPGIQTLAARLERFGSVTIVAPAVDQSAMGRAFTGEFEITERDRGFSVSGTPVDCIIAGIEALDIDPDLVVSGCNTGANLGGHTLGRSGTVSAAVEATFFSVPAIAVSLHVPESRWPLDATSGHFDVAADTTTYLVERSRDSSLFEAGGYLNVNVPFQVEPPVEMRVTRPSDRYDMMAIQEESRITIRDRTWDEFDDQPVEESLETDRGAVHRGYISVSPLLPPHDHSESDLLREIAREYRRIEEDAEMAIGED